MKAIVNKKYLAKQLSIADSITSSKSSIPILSNVLFETLEDKGRINITASNLETGVKVEGEAKIMEDGAIVVNGKKVLNVIRELPEDDVYIFTDEHMRLNVQSTNKSINAKFLIIGMDKENFPSVKTEIDNNYFRVKASLLKNFIKKVIFSISQDENKYALTGIFIEKYNGNLNIVATDGKRLALVEKPLNDIGLSDEDVSIPDGGVIIPKSALAEILRYNFEEEADIKISFSKNQMFLSYDNVNVVSNLIEGKFPDYKRIIPVDRKKFFIADREKLYNAVKRVSILVDESFKQIKFSILNDKLIVSTQSPTFGGAIEEIPIEYSGEQIDIALNYLFIMDCLKEIESDSIIMDFEDSDKAVTIRGKDEIGYINIVMPMKINI